MVCGFPSCCHRQREDTAAARLLVYTPQRVVRRWTVATLPLFLARIRYTRHACSQQRVKRSLFIVSLPLVLARSLCSEQVCSLTATLETKLDRGVLPVGHGTVRSYPVLFLIFPIVQDTRTNSAQARGSQLAAGTKMDHSFRSGSSFQLHKKGALATKRGTKLDQSFRPG